MVLKTTRTAVLTAAALDELMNVDRCCPHCCGRCWVLRDMVTENDLNKVLARVPVRFRSDSWWDEETGTARLLSITARWDQSCDHGIADAA